MLCRIGSQFELALGLYRSAVLMPEPFLFPWRLHGWDASDVADRQTGCLQE